MNWLVTRIPATGVLLFCLASGAAQPAVFQTSPQDPGLARVMEQVRAWRHSQPSAGREPATIMLQDGVYFLPVTLELPAADPGVASRPLTFEASPGTHPILSGGVRISGWQKSSASVPGLPASARGNIWVADIPCVNGRGVEFRQLWVNGQKAVRARQPNGEGLARLTGWDKTNEIAMIPAATLEGIQTPGRLEMIVDQVWEIADLRLKSISYQGTNAALTFQSPESRLEFQHPWPPVQVTSNYAAPFFLANAVQFLDSPGEWFEDLDAGKLYYWPRDGETMENANVIAPRLETLVHIEGTADRPASSIRFKGITFAYTTWLRPSEQGHVPLQAGMYLLGAKKLKPRGTPYHPGLDNAAWIGRPPAAVEVDDADQITFENCTFEHLGSAGLDYRFDTHDGLVGGCIFHDIGGNGIQLGQFSNTNVETHIPYNPPDANDICTHVQIANNILHDCANEDWGCTGICAGYVREARIEHNEVFDLPYTGISMGWGWTKMTNAMRDNLIAANDVHNVGKRLGDLGGIYLLSTQPGTVVERNVISDIQPSPYVPDPQHWFYLYLDEGSSFITVRDNWCPTEKFLRNANGAGNGWTNNGPQVSPEIKNAAGLEPAFRESTAGGPR